MEFVSVEVSCETEGCPNNGIESNTMHRLTESGELSQLVCGMCGIDLIPNPDASDEAAE
jgi:hypothetical protein